MFSFLCSRSQTEFRDARPTRANFFLPLILMLLGVASAKGADRPNVLFILTEDQGAQMGALGTAGLLTPHMDRLAKGGLLFREAFVAYPVCSASKGTLYTGRYATSAGILNNTLNFHKPASAVTDEERATVHWRKNRIRDDVPTLIESLRTGGFYTGVTHKLHVLPNDKFPYDEFLEHTDGATLSAFIQRAAAQKKSWFMLYNIEASHREFPNSDVEKIRVKPAEVQLPPFLPDTPKIRQDWAEYLAALEEADHLIGEALTALEASGQRQNTLIVFMGDHGPAFLRGKMTLHDLGLRVPMVWSGPGVKSGVITDQLASAVDVMPTLLDLLGLEAPRGMHGRSLRPILAGEAAGDTSRRVFAQISNRGPLPNDGLQERSVYDGRWKLIYREKVETRWRQVNEDSKYFVGPSGRCWGNRTYDEIVSQKEKFPEAFRMLAEMDPQSLGGIPPGLELYDLASDPHEMNNLANAPEHRAKRDELLAALKAQARAIGDDAMSWDGI